MVEFGFGILTLLHPRITKKAGGRRGLEVSKLNVLPLIIFAVFSNQLKSILSRVVEDIPLVMLPGTDFISS